MMRSFPFAAAARLGFILLLMGSVASAGCKTGTDGTSGTSTGSPTAQQPDADSTYEPMGAEQGDEAGAQVGDQPGIQTGDEIGKDRDRTSAARNTDDTTTGAAMHDDIKSKFDAALRNALARNPDEPLQVLVELADAPTAEQREDLEDTGLTRLNFAGNVATASGTPEAIRKAAGLDFVHSLSLSQERAPLD